MTKGRMLKRSLKISYHQGALPTRSNYKENWYVKIFPFEEGALKWYAKNSAFCVRTRTVNVNMFSTTVKDEILEGW